MSELDELLTLMARVSYHWRDSASLRKRLWAYHLLDDWRSLKLLALARVEDSSESETVSSER